jgi:hypothetical protein
LGSLLRPISILAGRDKQHELPKNLEMLLLGVWLIVTGLLQVVSISIPAIVTILALLAIVAGACLLLGRLAFLAGLPVALATSRQARHRGPHSLREKS